MAKSPVFVDFVSLRWFHERCVFAASCLSNRRLNGSTSTLAVNRTYAVALKRRGKNSWRRIRPVRRRNEIPILPILLLEEISFLKSSINTTAKTYQSDCHLLAQPGRRIIVLVLFKFLLFFFLLVPLMHQLYPLRYGNNQDEIKLTLTM